MKRIPAILLALGLAGAPLIAAAEEVRPLTPADQSNAKMDLRITQEIRKAVVADDSLSTNGHNVKIITVDGVVTLRGPVDSEAERSRIAETARGVAGVMKVNNQLEIARR
jgi:osmotically-inducible protein OsmY